MNTAQTAVAMTLVIVFGPIGFFLAAAALHTFWPIFGVIAYLDFGLAAILSVVLLITLRNGLPWWLNAPLVGLVCGAWAVAWVFRGFVSI